MNVEKFTEIITKNPLARASTSRFRQAGGTLWVKGDTEDKEKYIPAVSFMDTYVVEWGSASSSFVLASRSQGQLSTLKRKVKKAWLTQLAGPEESGYPFPAICVGMTNFPTAQMAVAKPTAKAIRMLLKGIHPDNETTRYEWSRASAWDGIGRARKELEEKLELLSETGGVNEYRTWRTDLLREAYKNSFKEPFEKVVQSLAYGAIKKENMLKNMTSPFFQLIETMYAKATSMTSAMEASAERYFAPINEESVANGTHHLKELNDKLEEFWTLSRIGRSAANAFHRLATSPDSCAARVSMNQEEEWDISFMRDVGCLDGRHNNYAPWLDKEPLNTLDHVDLMTVKSNLNRDGDDVTALERLRDITLVDHNMQSFSYYWVKKNIHKYIAVLNQIGCDVGQLFEGHPSEWDYTKIAAPLFLEEKNK